jgi:hypothetical protein
MIGPSGSGGAPSGLSTHWITGAEHESTPTEKWQPATAVPTSIQSSITGAHGRVYFTTGSTGNFNLEADYAFIAVRMRIRPTINVTDRMIELFDNNTSGGVQVRYRLINDGSFQVARGGSSVNLQTSATGLWSIDNWYTIEFAATMQDSGGTWTAKLWNDAGTLLGTLSGSGDTKETIRTTANFVILGSTGIAPYIDDISIDTAGALAGICQVETLYPNAAGDLSGWPRGGTDTGNNYDQVDEAVKDTTSYVQSSAADQFDAYNIGPRSITGTPLAVQVNALGRSATGTVTFKLLLRIGGVTYEGTKTHTWTSTSADTNKFEVWNNNPATGIAWSDSEINSLQIGYRSTSSNVRVHQLCAEVLVQT